MSEDAKSGDEIVGETVGVISVGGVEWKRGGPVTVRRNTRSKYPWKELAVGTVGEDGVVEGPSFLVVGARRAGSVQGMAYNAGKKLQRKFLVQAEGDGAYRVWRVS